MTYTVSGGTLNPSHSPPLELFAKAGCKTLLAQAKAFTVGVKP